MAINFENSFKKGLEAAEAATKVNMEIDLIFKDLDDQIKSASDGKISIVFKRKRDSLGALAGFISNSFQEPMKFKTYIVAVNEAAGGKEEDLAVFERASHGYPCHLSYGDQAIYCNDKAALEKQLSTMLANVNIGKQLTRLLNWPVLSAPDPSDEE
ncbi:hypothetical protein ABH912_006104 [Pseudomonas sp. BT76 TE3572]|uniref:hypothetical protein n=1 Tax=Pseudomonas sp. BT76 TE3572 TaxID=3349325 RepID=UPI003D245B61